MREAYVGQMSAYRVAVASLADLPLELVSTVLLLVSTGTAIEVLFGNRK